MATTASGSGQVSGATRTAAARPSSQSPRLGLAARRRRLRPPAARRARSARSEGALAAAQRVGRVEVLPRRGKELAFPARRGSRAVPCRRSSGRQSRLCLDLFHNPLAQDPDYWLYVIHLLPSVQLLDKKSVAQRERESALHLYHYERSGVMQSIAFGKRVDTPLKTTVGSSRCTQPSRRVMMPSDSEFGNQRNKEPFENPEDAVLLRAMARSVMEFSYIDWNSVATSQERQLKNKAAAEACKKLTVRFR